MTDVRGRVTAEGGSVRIARSEGVLHEQPAQAAVRRSRFAADGRVPTSWTGNSKSSLAVVPPGDHPARSRPLTRCPQRGGPIAVLPVYLGDPVRIFDVVVIGAGPAGEHVAARTAAAGLNTVVVEAVLRPRDRTSGGRHDLPRAQRPERAGITLVRGHGRLSGPRIVEVTGTDGAVLRLSALHAVAVCTGTRAALPPLPGLAALRPWTSREAAGATKVPPRLAIVGGGVAAVEMATAWQALGSQVTLVVPESGLLPRVERFAADLVTDALRASGVELRFDTTLSAATRAADVRLALSDGAVLHADELLLAAGRAPRTDDLGLETVGLRPGAWLPSDDTYTVPGVTGDWLYAVGDVNQRALLTHQAGTKRGSPVRSSPTVPATIPSTAGRGAATPERPTTSPSPRSS